MSSQGSYMIKANNSRQENSFIGKYDQNQLEDFNAQGSYIERKDSFDKD
jgi:hypothetical protein